MAFTATELLMNADLFRYQFPAWPGVTRSQAPVPDEAERCESCGCLPGCGCPETCVPRGTDPYFAELCMKGCQR